MKVKMKETHQVFFHSTSFYATRLVLYTCSFLALAFKHFAERFEKAEIRGLLTRGRATLLSRLTLAGG